MKRVTKKSVIISLLLITFNANIAGVCALDLNADRISNSAGMSFDNATSTITTNSNANQINKIKWSQFNIPGSQNVIFDFQAAGQTVLNYVAPGASPSQIFGNITMTSSAGTIQNGALILVNPNGISFNGGKVINLPNLDIGQFVASTHDIVDFDTILETATTFELTTYTPPQGGANGLLVTNGSEIGTAANPLRAATLYGNGVTVTGGSAIYATESTDNTTFYNNRIDISVGGGGDVYLDPTAASPIFFGQSVNTKQACTGIQDTSIRYYDYPSFNASPIVKGSKGQINLCSSSFYVGPGETATQSKGAFISANFSDVAQGAFTRLSNANITATGAITTTDNIIILISESSVGTGDNPIYVNSAQTFNILSDALGPVTITQSTTSVPTPPQPQPTGATTPIKFVATQGVTPIDAVDTRPIGIWQTDNYGNCLDCFSTPAAVVSSSSSSAAAIAIPLGIVGVGALGFAAFSDNLLGFAAPINTPYVQRPANACPGVSSVPVYDENGKIKYYKLINK